MRFNEEDFNKVVKCTCLMSNHDMDIEDLQDADLCHPECPIHGGCRVSLI